MILNVKAINFFYFQRVFKYFDSDNDGFIGKEEWITGLSVFLRGKTDFSDLSYIPL
jgi:hypothetical protein